MKGNEGEPKRVYKRGVNKCDIYYSGKYTRKLPPDLHIIQRYYIVGVLDLKISD